MDAVLKKSGGETLPVQLKNILRKRIETGWYKPGKRMDAVRKIATEFQVSSLTVQRACKLLEAENCIISVPQSGLFVNEKFTENPVRFMRIAFVFPEAQISPEILVPENWGLTSEFYRGLLAGAQEHSARIDFLYIDEKSSLREKMAQARKLSSEYDAAIFPNWQLYEIQKELADDGFPVFTVCDVTDEVPGGVVAELYDHPAALEILAEHAEKSSPAGVSVFSYLDTEAIPSDNSAYVSRANAFLDVCRKHGLKTGPEKHVIFDDGNKKILSSVLRKSEGDFIFCNNAYFVRDVYKAAMEIGFLPGREFQLAAIASGLTFTGLIPSLTFVRVPMFELARKTVSDISRMLNGKIPWEKFTTPMAEPVLMIRETTKNKGK